MIYQSGFDDQLSPANFQLDRLKCLGGDTV